MGRALRREPILELAETAVFVDDVYVGTLVASLDEDDGARLFLPLRSALRLPEMIDRQRTIRGPVSIEEMRHVMDALPGLFTVRPQ
jgi:hypothetical protein